MAETHTMVETNDESVTILNDSASKEVDKNTAELSQQNVKVETELINSKEDDASIGTKVPVAKEKCESDKNTDDKSNARTETSASEKSKSEELKAAMEPVTEDDLDMFDPDLFITDEEKKAFDYMIEKKKEEIVKSRETFEKWVDSLTRRRMFALSRLRKLGTKHRDRINFYGKVDSYVQQVEDAMQSVSSAKCLSRAMTGASSISASASVFSSREQSRETERSSRNINSSTNMQRESTGFAVPNESKDTGDENNNSESSSIKKQPKTSEDSPVITQLET